MGEQTLLIAAVWHRTARDARSLLCTILGDAAAAKPPLIPFNPGCPAAQPGPQDRPQATAQPTADLQVVKERLGRSSIVTTQKYLGTLDEADDTAINALSRIRNRARGRTA